MFGDSEESPPLLVVLENFSKNLFRVSISSSRANMDSPGPEVSEGGGGCTQCDPRIRLSGSDDFPP